MNKLRNILAAAAVAILAAGCGSADRKAGDSRLAIAVGVEPQRYILSQLLDSTEARVFAVIAPGANPETYELTPRRRMELEQADLYISTGLLPFEAAITSSLSTPVVNSSEGIELIYGSHGHDHEHHGHTHGAEDHRHDAGAPDPHVWTSTANARSMAANMAEAIGSLRPALRPQLARRLEDFNSRLDSIDSSIRARLAAPAAARSFAIWHPSLSYFARDYGLRQLAVGFESKEMPAGRLRAILDDAAADSVRVFFFQQEFDSRQAESVNNLLGSELIIINPLSADWEGQLNVITDALALPRR